MWLAALLCAVPAVTHAADGTDGDTLVIETEEIWSEDGGDVLTFRETIDEARAAPLSGGSRFLPVATDGYAPSRTPIVSIGPFHLISADTVEMIGTVDSDTPAAFARLLADHPGVRRLVMVECPGSIDEDANHRLARAVRRAGIATHVPAGGSVRSGAVELWLAGATRTAERSAEFGVHSWRDEDGRDARDYAASDPVHSEYLAFYREMGLNERTAREFYALTNSVGFDEVRMLSSADIARLGLITVAG